jgi:hypothetical protein
MLAPLVPSLPYVPARNVTVIVDQLESSAEFLLHRALSLQLKDGLPCTLVATSNDLAHWSSISARSVSERTRGLVMISIDVIYLVLCEQNLTLAAYLSSKALVFIDGTAVVSARAREDTKEPPLRLLYDRIAASLRSPLDNAKSPHLVVLDDISSFEWIGISVVDLSRFARAVRALCIQVRALN